MIENPDIYGSLDPKFYPSEDVVLNSPHVSDKVKQVWRELDTFDYGEKPHDITGILETRPEHIYEDGDLYIG